GVEFDESSVRSSIQDAESNLATADRRLGNNLYGLSIEKYRQAWVNAQDALDQMDSAVSPNVTISDRTDMPTDTYYLSVRVFDVRTRNMKMTVSVNGDNRTFDAGTLNTSPVPGVERRFVQNISLDTNVTELKVWVTQTDSGQSGTAVLKLDSDGLPDVYEEKLGTDPLDRDSDLPSTSENEADNNVLDGAEDFDDDSLMTYRENRLGTDALTADTDGDGLEDGFEARYTNLDPLVTDTDGDGVGDADEDPDSDGLTNLEEQDAGTSPLNADTDFDELNDSEEINVYGTEPLDEDTDNDTFLDGEEIKLGTDPLSADSDGDGVEDANETYTTTAENEDLGAKVEITGEGNVAETVSISEPSNVMMTTYAPDAFSSEAVNIETGKDFESANITLEYNESQLQNESAVGVFTYNETKGKYEALL
ncbi:MAG: hypothetical protein SXQ77_08820, partial [Halobacteria archaeon]|nr:hypothetical protein [Halobacteria archaeon]